MIFKFGRLFYVPLLAPLALLLLPPLRRPWAAPTLLWAAALAAAALLLGGDATWHHSLPLQLAVLLPLNLAAVETLFPPTARPAGETAPALSVGTL